MKRLLNTVMAFFVTVTLFAQAPNAFNYQGIARDLSGNPIINKNIGLRISILQGSITGSAVYKELFLISTSNTGLFNIQIGYGTPVSGSVETINWGNGPFYLKIEMDENGGSNYQMIGTSQLLSVPYALYAEKSGSSFNFLPPTAEATNVTNPGASSVTLNGIVNANGFKTDVVFEWGTSTLFGNSKQLVNPVKGSENTPVSVNITGLQQNTDYFFRIKASNAIDNVVSNTVSFKFATLATVITSNPTNLRYDKAVVGGYVITEGNAPVTERGVVYSTSANPTVSNSKKIIGKGLGAFSDSIVGLSINTKYYVKAYAINSYGISYGNEVNFTLYMNLPDVSISDCEGNSYKTVKIGSQIWMAENLKTKKYRDCSDILYVTDRTLWNNLTTGAYSYFRDLQSNGNTYGGLYNYYAVTDPRGICPAGWHVPSKNEWAFLFDFLGGVSVAGNKLKETGISHWTTANGTNISGFTALAGSWRGGDGLYYYSIRDMGNWWTTTMQAIPNYPWFIWIGTGGETYITADPYHDIHSGNSIRCLKD